MNDWLLAILPDGAVSALVTILNLLSSCHWYDDLSTLCL